MFCTCPPKNMSNTYEFSGHIHRIPIYIFPMDQTSLNAETLITQLPALTIQGHGEALEKPTTLLYRQPGYSTPNLDLMSLITKPMYLPPVTIDSSFVSWQMLISSLQPTFNQWIPKFIENFVSPRFNLQLTLVIPGHQFAIVKLGATYIPSLVADNYSFVPSSTYKTVRLDNLSVYSKYNLIRATNGVMFSLADSSKTITLKSTIPTNYAMNPLDLTNLDRNILFGGFYLCPITPVRFGMSLTSVIVRPIMNLVDVSLMPWSR